MTLCERVPVLAALLEDALLRAAADPGVGWIGARMQAVWADSVDALGTHLGTVPTAVPLLPGASTLVELAVPLGPGPRYDFVAVVDDDAAAGGGIVEECREDNNRGGIEDLDCMLI